MIFEKIIDENKTWIDEIWGKIENKLSVTAELSKDKIPYKTEGGIHDDYGTENPSWWTNGFWPGIMWLMYIATKDEKYKITAEIAEKKMDKVLFEYENIHHDVGFMWHLSAGANYIITGNKESKRRNLLAAATLASRYNVDGGFIRAWNNGHEGWAIIDCMMNIPLLYWASNESGDPRFKQIAMHHADKAMANHIRPDGSVIHVVKYDVNNGEVLDYPFTQGYDAVNSCWSRGQGWALYGFVLSYLHTGKQEYLDTAKRVAHYFISAIADDGYVPKCDFRSPEEPVYLDTSAGAIVACGLIEIAKAVPEYEKKLYLNAAVNILKELEKKHCIWSIEEQSILQNSTVAYSREQNVSLIYGDYYFIEAIYKLKGFKTLLW